MIFSITGGLTLRVLATAVLKRKEQTKLRPRGQPGKLFHSFPSPDVRLRNVWSPIRRYQCPPTRLTRMCSNFEKNYRIWAELSQRRRVMTPRSVPGGFLCVEFCCGSLESQFPLLSCFFSSMLSKNGGYLGEEKY